MMVPAGIGLVAALIVLALLKSSPPEVGLPLISADTPSMEQGENGSIHQWTPPFAWNWNLTSDSFTSPRKPFVGQPSIQAFGIAAGLAGLRPRYRLCVYC